MARQEYIDGKCKACVHGKVCREYLRKGRGIICQTCPRGCSFYEPVRKAMRCDIHLSGAQIEEIKEWLLDELESCECPNCGERVVF